MPDEQERGQIGTGLDVLPILFGLLLGIIIGSIIKIGFWVLS